MQPVPSAHVSQLAHAIISELENSDAKKLKFAKCPSCKKLNCYRLASLKDSPLKCKSCNTTIPVKRHGFRKKRKLRETLTNWWLKCLVFYPLGELKLCLGVAFVFCFASKLEKFLARNSNANGNGRRWVHREFRCGSSLLEEGRLSVSG